MSNASVASINLLELERLQRFGGITLVRDLIDRFLVETPMQLRTARQALSNGHLQSVELTLRSLRLSATRLGAVRMQTLTAEAESLVARDVAVVAALLHEMDREFEQLHALLQQARPRFTVHAA
jgi:HPt (histidine-containing phosphotransfer) domain-containing protein